MCSIGSCSSHCELTLRFTAITSEGISLSSTLLIILILFNAQIPLIYFGFCSDNEAELVVSKCCYCKKNYEPLLIYCGNNLKFASLFPLFYLLHSRGGWWNSLFVLTGYIGADTMFQLED